MLDKKDIALLRGMFHDQNAHFDQKLQDLQRNMRDETHSLIHASESRLRKEMRAMEIRIVSGIAELLDTTVLPQIAELQEKVGIRKLGKRR